MGRLFGGLLTLIGLIALVAVGGYFALKRDDIPYETLAARYENAASRYVDLPNGVRMHYRAQGADGPVLLLIHGYSASLHTWEPWAERLGDEYRVISIDLPGHGLTSAPAGYAASIGAYRDLVEAFAQAQGLTHFAIAGNSMGGRVAWEYALAHPERVDALILVDAAGFVDRPDENAQEPIAFKLIRNPITGPLLLNLDNTAVVREGLGKSFADPAFVSDEMVARYVDLSRAPGHRQILLAMMTNPQTPATAEQLAAIDRPTLIIWGDKDNLIPVRHAELFRAAIANSRVQIFENVGHLPQEEVADASADTVREFLYPVYESVSPEGVE
ncbi:MAG: alpha/beta hydrolase [Hyphomonadaceae bacterium]|nr:alpha/beta hydrolase [Hyphomonadaceae bacterium]